MRTLRQRIRHAELSAVRQYFSSPVKVLELGGATGFQAMIMHEWGNDVTSLDVDVPPGESYYPVQPYDGRHLPFSAETFDVVFSSNVLEHIEDLPGILAEARRVLRPSGFMIHIVPSSVWRFWTNISHYVWVLLSVVGRPVEAAPECGLESRVGGTAAGTTRRYSPSSVMRRLWRALVPQPHGVYPNALAELYFYSGFRWRRFFQCQGFTVAKKEPAGIFYTGYKVVPCLDVDARRALARVLGSSCHIFIVRVPSAESTELHR